MAEPVRLTVAVCTWNRAGLLDRTLGHLAGLDPPGTGWELVVVDNRSTDRTPAVLARWAASGRLPLRADREDRQGLSHARNRALDLARGRWLLWTDDDVRPDPGWLRAAAAATARHPHAAGIGGPVRPWFPHPPDPDLAAVFAPLRTGYCGVDHGPAERELRPAEEVYGANMGFNRAVIGGLRFDPTLGRNGRRQGGGEDLDYLGRARAAGPVVWVPGMGLDHYVCPDRMTLGYVRRFVLDAPPPWAAPPPDRAGRLFGVPRWLVARYLRARADSLVRAVRGPRADRLAARVACWRLEHRMAHYRRAGGVPGG